MAVKYSIVYATTMHVIALHKEKEPCIPRKQHNLQTGQKRRVIHHSSHRTRHPIHLTQRRLGSGEADGSQSRVLLVVIGQKEGAVVVKEPQEEREGAAGVSALRATINNLPTHTY